MTLYVSEEVDEREFILGEPLTDRDLEALGKVARQRRVPLAEALRLVMREALGIPALPKKGKASHD